MHRFIAFLLSIAFAHGATALAHSRGEESAAERKLFPPEGELRAEGMDGGLHFSRDARGAWRFSISTTSAGGNLCQFEGALDGRTGTAIADSHDAACEIAFTPMGDAIGVAYRTHEACRAFCGLNATTEGTYWRVPEGCDEAGIVRVRDAAAREHRAGDSVASRKALEATLDRCGRVLSRRDSAWVRNDLALALLRLGRPQECIAVLQPIDDLLRSPDHDPEALMLPLERDVMGGLVGATSFNWSACERALPALTPIADGIFVDEGAWSEVSLSTAADGTRRLEAHSVTALGAVCEFIGVMDKATGVATANTEFDFPPCRLRLIPEADGLRLSEWTPGSCRHACGYNGSFGGLHRHQPPACRETEVAAARQRYKHLYDSRRVPEALAVLEPVLSQCASRIPFSAEAWVRNDLSVGYRQLGRESRCREVLRPLSNLVLDTEGEPIAHWPIISRDVLKAEMRATTTNWRACGAARPVNED